MRIIAYNPLQREEYKGKSMKCQWKNKIFYSTSPAVNDSLIKEFSLVITRQTTILRLRTLPQSVKGPQLGVQPSFMACSWWGGLLVEHRTRTTRTSLTLQKSRERWKEPPVNGTVPAKIPELLGSRVNKYWQETTAASTDKIVSQLTHGELPLHVKSSLSSCMCLPMC